MKLNESPIQSSRNPKLSDQVNWREVKQSLSSQSFLHIREIIFFAHSDEIMKNCQSTLNASNLTFRNHFSFCSALRDSSLLTADIFVLIDSFASASRKNFAKLLKQRTHKDLKVIIWDKLPLENLILTIQESLSKLNQSETKNLVVEKILQSRMEINLNHNEKNSLDEEDFRKLLNRELSVSENHAPEIILANAINIIKEVN